MKALTKLRQYFLRIDSPEVFIEETVYLHLPSVLAFCKRQGKFAEQHLDFDFTPGHSLIAQNFFQGS